MEKTARYQEMEISDEFHELDYEHHRIQASRGVLEQAARQLRSFARWVTGCRVESDELVEDTLTLFLAKDRVLTDHMLCFADLLMLFRRLYQAPDDLASTTEQAQWVTVLSLPEREVSALVIGAGLDLAEAAELLGLSPEQARPMLDHVRILILTGQLTLPDWLLPAETSLSLS